MKSRILKGHWQEIKGSVKEHWGRLSDDDLEHVRGRAERLAGMLQKRYGWERKEARKQLGEFLAYYES